MKVEDKALEKILEGTPSDDKWDLNSVVEKGLAAAGERRYDMNCLAKGYKEGKFTEFQTETVGRTQDKQLKTPMPIDDGEPAPPKIKVENPIFVEYLQQINVLKSGKGTVGCGIA